MVSELANLIEKSIFFVIEDSYYLLPIIGSIQIFFIGLFLKRNKFIYLSIFLFLIFSSLFPFVKLIPNLGSDAFSEFQKLNFKEAYFYIKTLNLFAGWNSKRYILWFFIIINYTLLIYLIFIVSKKIKSINFKIVNYIIVIGLIFIPTFINLFKVTNLYNSSIEEKKNQLKNINYKLEKLNIKLEKPRDLSLIYYIGESTSRLHWSIYKYFRPTNKKLENFREGSSLILFDEVYSTHTHTSPSLLDALTIKMKTKEKNDLKIISDYIRYPVVDILNEVEINTNLFSTQSKSGSWNLASSLIFKNANKKIYSSNYNLGNANYINLDKPFDHEFLDELIEDTQKYSKKNSFFVFHSYAGHGNYKKNIPKKYHKKIDEFYSNKTNKAIFGKVYKNNQKKFLEDYDSAMNYISDNIVYTLDKISKLKKPMIFVYTSDHGESPLTGLGHDSSRYIWDMSSVPFLVYFNDEARLRYPALYNQLNLRSQKKNRETLSNFTSLILEIFGVKIFDKNSNIDKASECKFGEGNCFEKYHIVRNQLNTLGVVSLEFPVKTNNNFKDNTDRATTHANIKDYFSKKNSKLEVCSHRTNSIARFIRFNAILNCMEIDVLIKDDHLDVTHSMDKSTSLKLVDLLKIQKNKRNILWLDVKNINSSKQCDNLSNILKKFTFTNNKFSFFIEFPPQIKDNFNKYKECISTIRSMNFPVSYYIPNDIESYCSQEEEISNSSEKKCLFVEKLLKEIYESNLFTDLSFDYQNYQLLKTSNYLNKFSLNTWHIPDEDIALINDENFRLIIPFNDDVNYN